MARAPAWYRQLNWSKPLSLAQIAESRRNNREFIPDFPGLYIFTLDSGGLRPGRVVYVGESKSLRERLKAYFVDWTIPKKKEGHKAKGFILQHRAERGDHGVFLRWVEYGGAPIDRFLLEASLIVYLEPEANSRDEEVRHGVLSDWETLDPRLLRG